MAELASLLDSRTLLTASVNKLEKTGAVSETVIMLEIFYSCLNRCNKRLEVFYKHLCYFVCIIPQHLGVPPLFLFALMSKVKNNQNTSVIEYIHRGINLLKFPRLFSKPYNNLPFLATTTKKN